MSVSLFMTMCLHDPKDGYYATRAAFNRDFTTAPETSQIFGELLGLWSGLQWMAMGRPAAVNLLELGPGRGTMMADVLRAARTVPGFSEALEIALLESSPLLRSVQQHSLKSERFIHIGDLSEAPDGPTIILGNEFLDCLPIRQFVRWEGTWRERQVGFAAGPELTFGLSPPVEPPPDLDASGDEAEYAPALDTFVDFLSRRFIRSPGCALLIDYGPHSITPSDTLRAYEAGRQVDPLAAPGSADLTADVDFRRLNNLAKQRGLSVYGPITQGCFLSALGARERAHVLARANPMRAEEIMRGAGTLVSPGEMGERFKVIAIASPGLSAPAGFTGAG